MAFERAQSWEPGARHRQLLGRRQLGTTVEVADYLGVPVATLHAWRSRKKGPPASRVGKHLRYRWEDVEAWIDAHGVGGESA